MLDGGMLRKQVPRPGQRDRRRFVPGNEEGDHLVAQLLVAHCLARILVTRFHEQREQVPALGGAAGTACGC